MSKESIFNRYQDYDQESNRDAREYEKRCYEREERFHEDIRMDLDKEYYGDEE